MIGIGSFFRSKGHQSDFDLAILRAKQTQDHNMDRVRLDVPAVKLLDSDTVAKCISSCAKLIVVNQQSGNVCLGSSTALDQDYLLTCGHVTTGKQNSRIFCVFFDPVQEANNANLNIVQARLIASNPLNDLALLAIDPQSKRDGFQVTPSQLSTTDPNIGETVYTASFGGAGSTPVLTSGIVLAEDERNKALRLLNPRGTSFLGSTNPTIGGDSGGKVCNKDDQLCGVITNSNMAAKPISRAEFFSRIVQRRGLDLTPHTLFKGVEQHVLPFLKELKVDINDLLQGKPINSISDMLYRRFRKLF